MALQSCYECNKEISTKAIICPQCGAPQNPVSGLVDKVKKGFLGKTFKNLKENATKAIDRKMEEIEIGRKFEEELMEYDDFLKQLPKKIEEELEGKLHSYAPSTSTLNTSLFQSNLIKHVVKTYTAEETTPEFAYKFGTMDSDEEIERAYDEADEMKRKINEMEDGKFEELIVKKLTEVLERKYGVPFKQHYGPST